LAFSTDSRACSISSMPHLLPCSNMQHTHHWCPGKSFSTLLPEQALSL
jgi:hypothetical protein